jgi:WXXGXW repeat (2 copies)
MTPSRIEIAVALACWSVAPHSALAQPIPLMPPPAAPGGNGPRFNTHSVVATDLTSPTLLIDGTPGGFLEAARTALQRGRTADAQVALERAETRLLDRPAGPARDDVPDHTRTVLDIDVARRALAMRDRPGAIRAIDGALAASALASWPASPARVAVLPASAPLVPAATYALLPGHWQLDGARYVWAPAETRLHRVEDQPFVQGRYLWRDGAWTWVPSHFGAE